MCRKILIPPGKKIVTLTVHSSINTKEYAMFNSLIRPLICLCVTSGLYWAYGADAVTPPLGAKLLFEDSFERNESQEEKDEVGNGWTTNSKSRAADNKQVDLKNGAMYIYIHEKADHAVSVRQDVEFKDGYVTMRFMLENDSDILGLDFGDSEFKEVHAGHLFKVTISTKKVDIDDMKSGGMNLKFYDAKKEGKLTAEQKKFIASKKKSEATTVASGKWHDLLVTIIGDKVMVAINGQQVSAFSSEGFAHPTKRMLRLAVPKQAVVDDIKIYSLLGEEK